MTIGTGVFLSSLFLGLVFLYVFTRDRWKWKKIIFRTVAADVILILLLATSIYGVNWYQERPQRAASLWGVSIGASESDVKFVKGEPSEVEDKDDDGSKRPRWTYLSDDVMYVVDFKDAKVTRVATVGNRLRLPSASGLSALASLDDITKKLGPPSYISRSTNELKRAYSFPKYNVAFGIEG